MALRGPRHERAYIRAWHEDEWVSADELVYVDLHWRLAPRRLPFRLEPERLWPRLETAGLEGKSTRTLALEPLLVCLCAHGTKDRWRRLIWLCDIDRALRRRGPPDWRALQALAATARCRRALALGLFLARTLLGAPVPDPSPATVPEPGRAVLGRIRRSFAEGEPPASFLQEWLELRRAHIDSLDGVADRLRYVWRTVLTPDAWDWDRFQLPDAVYPLYYVLRPLRLLGRGGKVIWRRLGRPGRPERTTSTSTAGDGWWRRGARPPG